MMVLVVFVFVMMAVVMRFSVPLLLLLLVVSVMALDLVLDGVGSHGANQGTRHSAERTATNLLTQEAAGAASDERAHDTALSVSSRSTRLACSWAALSLIVWLLLLLLLGKRWWSAVGAGVGLRRSRSVVRIRCL
jgi:hypothetical protein